MQITAHAVEMSVTIDSNFSLNVTHLKPGFQTIVLVLSLFQIINEVGLDEMFPHGGVNMTGLQLVNHANDSVRQYVQEWMSNSVRSNSFVSTSNRNIMSVSSGTSIRFLHKHFHLYFI